MTATLTLLSIKVDSELKELLRTVAARRGEDPSSFARRAIKLELARMGYMSPEESKALGVNNSEAKGVVEAPA